MLDLYLLFFICKIKNHDIAKCKAVCFTRYGTMCINLLSWKTHNRHFQCKIHSICCACR